MNKKPLSLLPVSKPGDRIVIDPSIAQPEDVLDLETYKELLKQMKKLKEERHRLHQIIVSYPIEERRKIPEWEQSSVLGEQYRSLNQEYHRRLPIHLLAQCPYCGTHVLQPVDSFSLMGCDASLLCDQGVHFYGSDWDWYENVPPRQRCPHTLCVTRSVNLNGLHPDDVAGWMLSPKWGSMYSEPSVIVWPLIARCTSAVIHALPVGRLDDGEPIHRYTAYYVTYFASDDTNLRTEEMWVPTDLGEPATGAVQGDRDVIKWVKAGRLFWLNPDNPGQLVRVPVEAFPYSDVEMKGWYKILEGGRLDGPKPYLRNWQGEAPPHDESFPETIEPYVFPFEDTLQVLLREDSEKVRLEAVKMLFNRRESLDLDARATLHRMADEDQSEQVRKLAEHYLKNLEAKEP